MKITKVSLGQEITGNDIRFQLLFHLLCPSSSVTALEEGELSDLELFWSSKSFDFPLSPPPPARILR